MNRHASLTTDRGYHVPHNKSIGGKLAKHTDNPDRNKNDFYPTEPEATYTLLDHLETNMSMPEGTWWEPACGTGHISLVLEARGLHVVSTDIAAEERGFGVPMDFLQENFLHAPNIITNPPYSLLSDFIRHGLELNPQLLALHVPMQALFQVGRKRLLEEVGYPQELYVFVPTLKVDRFLNGEPEASVFNHVWACWYQGVKQHFSKMTMVDWRHHVPQAQGSMFA